jgi:hypothetical protein
LFVQWTEPEERRAFRDPSVNPERLALPYDFTGHLVDRSEVGGNYEKIWTFYDCLESYTLRQCKHCLGLIDMVACREKFTCAESFPADECEVLLAPEAGPSPKRTELERLAAEIELDELTRRVEALAKAIDERRKRVEAIEREIEAIDTGKMKERIDASVADVERRNAEGDEEKRRLEARVRELGLEPDGLRGDVKRLQDEVSIAKSEQGALTGAATAHKADSDALTAAEGDEAQAEATAAIEERIREELTALRAPTADDAGADDAGADEAGPIGDAGPVAGEEAERAARVAELEADLEALAAGTLVDRRAGQISDIKNSLAAIEERLTARKKELEEREQLAEDLAELPREARERKDKLDELRGDLKLLASGAMKEEKQAILASLAPGLERLKKLEPQVADLIAELERLTPGKVGDIERRIDELEELVGPPIWILIDGETPGDKIWVVAVYLVFLVMIVFNLRRLYRFWIAWRS